jgi:hypothetical protein
VQWVQKRSLQSAGEVTTNLKAAFFLPAQVGGVSIPPTANVTCAPHRTPADLAFGDSGQAHHGSTSPRFASTLRNHGSRPVSTDFCNKICQKPTRSGWRFWREADTGQRVSVWNRSRKDGFATVGLQRFKRIDDEPQVRIVIGRETCVGKTQRPSWDAVSWVSRHSANSGLPSRSRVSSSINA